jgi:zona occludens toxin
MTLVLLVALPLLGYFAYRAIMRVTHGDSIKTTSVSQAQGADVKNPLLVPPSLPSKPSAVTWSDLDKYPRSPNAPESAPVYDDLRKVVAMPSIVGCVSSAKSCRCYDQRGFQVVAVTASFCSDWIASGGHFNPYQPDASPSSAPAEKPQPDRSQVAFLGSQRGRDSGDTVNLTPAPDFLLN